MLAQVTKLLSKSRVCRHVNSKPLGTFWRRSRQTVVEQVVAQRKRELPYKLPRVLLAPCCSTVVPVIVALVKILVCVRGEVAGRCLRDL